MSASCRVYIGRLSSEASERDVARFFKGFGKITEIMLKNGYGFVQFEDARDADDAIDECGNKELAGQRVTLEKARGTPHGRDYYRDVAKGYIDRDRYERRDRGGDRGGDRGDRGERRRYSRSRSRSREKRRPRRSPSVSKSRSRSRSGSRNDPRDGKSSFVLLVENLSSRCSSKELKGYFKQYGKVVSCKANTDDLKKRQGLVEFADFEDMKRALLKMDGFDINGKEIVVSEQVKNGGAADGSPRKSRSLTRSPSRGSDRKSDDNDD